MNEPTHFTESNALLAVVREDDDEARRVLRTMTRGELRGLRHAATRLAFLVQDHIEGGDYS